VLPPVMFADLYSAALWTALCAESPRRPRLGDHSHCLGLPVRPRRKRAAHQSVHLKPKCVQVWLRRGCYDTIYEAVLLNELNKLATVHVIGLCPGLICLLQIICWSWVAEVYNWSD